MELYRSDNSLLQRDQMRVHKDEQDRGVVYEMQA